jgi:galactose mutarotase-like enzyme
LTNHQGLVMKVITYGAIVTEFHAPDRNGKQADIAAGFESLEKYLQGSPYMGAAIGRIANRIKDGKFTLEGKQYTLATNNGPHHLHGGKKGWDKVIWTAEPSETARGPAITFRYVSKDGEEGFPGTVSAKLTYTLTHENEFVVDMEATTDKTTIVGMAHHTYWNLGGYDSGTILDHELMIAADKYTPGKVFHPKSDPVPYGEVQPVAGTPFDFTKPKPIGEDNQAVKGTPVGYDNNWVVNGDPKSMRLAAKFKDDHRGGPAGCAVLRRHLLGRNPRGQRHQVPAVRGLLHRDASVPECDQRSGLEGPGHSTPWPDLRAPHDPSLHHRALRRAGRHCGGPRGFPRAALPPQSSAESYCFWNTIWPVTGPVWVMLSRLMIIEPFATQYEYAVSSRSEIVSTLLALA